MSLRALVSLALQGAAELGHHLAERGWSVDADGHLVDRDGFRVSAQRVWDAVVEAPDDVIDADVIDADE